MHRLQYFLGLHNTQQVSLLHWKGQQKIVQEILVQYAKRTTPHKCPKSD